MFKGSIVALVTPMLDDGSVDFVSLRTLIEYHIDSGTDGIVVVGTTGESVTLSFTEQQAVIGFVVDVVNKRIPVIAGNGTNNTAQAVARTQALNALDIDGFLTVVPYYNKPSQQGLLAHFSAIAAATDKPLLLYNVPSRTVCDLQAQTVIKLAQISNIVGIKEATGDMGRLDEIKAACPADFILLSGDDSSMVEFIRHGGHGVISVTANVAPKAMAEVCRLALNGFFSDALAIDENLNLLHKRLFVAPSPAPAKWILQQFGLISCANVRLPLLCLEPIDHNAVKEAMKMAGLI